MPSKVSVKIDSSDCGGDTGLGVPGFPNDKKDLKLSNKVSREAFNTYTQNCNLLKTDAINSALSSNVFSLGSFNFEFPFERNTYKTYKFLGMEIDEDFRAVITIPSGTVVVGYMYSGEAIKKLASVLFNDNSMIDKVSSVVDKTSTEDIRRLCTAMKTGKLYDMKRGSKNGTLDVATASSLVSYIKGSNSKSSSEYSSITLRLIHKKKEEDLSEIGVSATDEDEMNVYGMFMSCVMTYWDSIIEYYNQMYTTLGCLDLWSDAYKKIYGEASYYGNMDYGSCITVTNPQTGEVLDNGTVSFSGIAKNGGIFDDNIIRSNASTSLNNLASLYLGKVTAEVDLDDLLLGCADTTGIDDVYSLKSEEIQALSIIDSLAFIDEDATLIKDTYDMNDPDDRGLYTKSIIKSYEKNFKDYKPVNSYDVTDAMADMVERSDEENATLVDVNGEAISVEDILTSSKTEIDVLTFKKNLIKVLKLIDKALERVNKGF